MKGLEKDRPQPTQQGEEFEPPSAFPSGLSRGRLEAERSPSLGYWRDCLSGVWGLEAEGWIQTLVGLGL